MGALSGELRRQLERSIVAARDEAERAARAALETLGVKRREAYPGISDEDRQLRVQLRARARQLGEGDFEAGIKPLVEEIAYEGWHRMLFARFLAENKLLMHASGVAVTLEECAELTREEIEPDAWMVAARYAGAMLPGIFRQDDPSSRVRFAPEGRNALERILTDLPSAVFTAGGVLPGARRSGLGVPILAEQSEEGGQRQRCQDRREGTAGCHTTLYRGLYGPLPPGELAWSLVGGSAS